MKECAAARALDWSGLLRAGLQRLRLSPAAFWALSPVELLVMLGLEQGAGAGPLGRARLSELAALYPDGDVPGNMAGISAGVSVGMRELATAREDVDGREL